MIALRDELLTGDYDIVVLQEKSYNIKYPIYLKRHMYVNFDVFFFFSHLVL